MRCTVIVIQGIVRIINPVMCPVEMHLQILYFKLKSLE